MSGSWPRSHRAVMPRCDSVDGARVDRRAAHDHRKDESRAWMLINFRTPEPALPGLFVGIPARSHPENKGPARCRRMAQQCNGTTESPFRIALSNNMMQAPLCICGSNETFRVAEPADKPGSVVDSHSSRRNVAVTLEQPTRTRRGPRHEVPIWPCSRWGLPCHATLAPHAVRSYRTISPLPRASPLPKERFDRSAVCFLLH